MDIVTNKQMSFSVLLFINNYSSVGGQAQLSKEWAALAEVRAL